MKTHSFYHRKALSMKRIPNRADIARSDPQRISAASMLEAITAAWSLDDLRRQQIDLAIELLRESELPPRSIRQKMREVSR